MPRTVYYTATTLDGFIATPDHRLDWLVTRQVDNNGPMGYDTFIADIGAIAMGANTYRWILDNHPDMEWPYTMPAWVLTHRDFDPRTDGADVRYTQQPVTVVHKEMTEAAASAVQSVEVWPMKEYKPTEMVWRSGRPRVNTRGIRKSFQELMNTNKPRVASIGLASGSAMRK